jgi:hypothetical protein
MNQLCVEIKSQTIIFNVTQTSLYSGISDSATKMVPLDTNIIYTTKTILGYKKQSVVTNFNVL